MASDAEVGKHIVCLVAENPFSSIPAVTWDMVKNLVFKDMVCRNRSGNLVSKVPYIVTLYCKYIYSARGAALIPLLARGVGAP